jgi:hypothetical protein
MALDFPNSPSVNDLYTVNGQTWSYNGSAWVVRALASAIATGSITEDKIANGSITAAKIADGTIVAAEIADSAITTAKINNLAVTTAKINADAVTTAKIADGAVTAAKLGNDISLTPADGSITAAKIASNAVTTAKILDANVTQAKLGTTLSAVTITTAANRDTAVTSPFTGQLVFLTDTKKIQVWDGASWLNITMAPPEPPTSLSATALSTTSVSVSFTPGAANGSPITNYKYALSTNGGSTYGSPIAVDPVDITSPITISGLTPGVTYHITLKAVNDLGDSVASSATSVTTLATPDAPTSLSAGNITTTSVDISFTPGSQGGSAISNYQYALSTDGGSSYGSFTALSPSDATSPITISGLTTGTAYYVKIKAVNNDGAGTESSALSFGTTMTVDYLVLAGGGGSNGAYYQGGAGAGGLRSSVSATGGGGSVESSLSLSPGTNYAVTVGSGGAGGVGIGGVGANGASSVFSTITSLGGSRASGGTGGCGGAGEAGTAGQGYAGGTPGSTSSYGTSGGGGGTGAVGGNGNGSSECSAAGNGGSGASNNITGSSVTYGGGGGGSIYGVRCGSGSRGSGGAGGGGAGASTYQGISAVSGTANLGGGGGGANHASTANGGSGGSGVIILRYPDTKTITFGAGVTGTESSASGGYKRATITAGSGNVSWA